MAEAPDKIKWHPAFLAATELEFRENLEELEFEPEHHLSKEPIRMDLLILKKRGTTRLSNEIGHIMRKHNIIEYKGPGDQLTIDTLYKVLGYASLYKAYGTRVDEIPADEITISMFRWSYPDKLMSKLMENGYGVEQKYHGIYYITGNLLFPIQIVIMKQLAREWHSSLRILTKKADIKDIRQFLGEAEELQGKRDRNNIDALLQVSVRANETMYEKVRSEQHMCEALKELMKDEFEKERQIAITEGRAEGMRQGRSEGMRQGRAEGMRQGRAEGMLEGRRQGEYDALIKLVIAKIKKNKTVEETADMLEESPETIQKIYDLAEKMAPDYDSEKILEQLNPFAE